MGLYFVSIVKEPLNLPKSKMSKSTTFFCKHQSLISGSHFASLAVLQTSLGHQYTQEVDHGSAGDVSHRLLCCYVYVLCQLAYIDNFLEAQLDSPATLHTLEVLTPPDCRYGHGGQRIKRLCMPYMAESQMRVPEW